MHPSLRLLSLLILATATAALSAGEGGHWGAVAGSAGGLILGIIQVAVGLGIAAFAITKGLQVVSKLLDGLDIWGEIKKKNIAVALLAAGVVISYTSVIGSGIESMTKGLVGLASLSKDDWGTALSAIIGGALNLTLAIILASTAITLTFKVMDKLTKDIDEVAELKANNFAIGAIYGGILIGVSNLVAKGVSGLSTSITTFLKTLIAALF